MLEGYRLVIYAIGWLKKPVLSQRYVFIFVISLSIFVDQKLVYICKKCGDNAME